MIPTLNRFLVVGCLTLVLASFPTSSALAQGLPKAQPKLISILRESVKAGHNARHAKHEAGWPAAYEKAKSPDHYLALTSMTGPNEAWYVMAWESYASMEASMKRDEKDPVLSSELERLSEHDAEHIDASHAIEAVARPDLGIGVFPELGKIRFLEIGTFKVRLGKQAVFEEGVKVYGAARKRTAPKSNYRVYEVIAGMPGGTYLVFASFENYSAFDQMLVDDEATFKSATPEELAVLEKFGDAVISMEHNRFRIDPVQSYVPKEVREQDPSFWMPK